MLVLYDIRRALAFLGLKSPNGVLPIDQIFVNHYLSPFALRLIITLFKLEGCTRYGNLFLYKFLPVLQYFI